MKLKRAEKTLLLSILSEYMQTGNIKKLKSRVEYLTLRLRKHLYLLSLENCFSESKLFFDLI
jgi:transcriptional regulator with AAA-type ATPase domain